MIGNTDLSNAHTARIASVADYAAADVSPARFAATSSDEALPDDELSLDALIDERELAEWEGDWWMVY